MNISFLQSAKLLRKTALLCLFSVLSLHVQSQDTIPPVITCINGLAINQLNGPNHTMTLWASDFLLNATDNITPINLLKFGIRKSGTGTGFPMINGIPMTSVTFHCVDVGVQFVELWVMDEAGNSSFCETYVLIQDNSGFCGDPYYYGFGGQITNEQQQGVEDATIDLEYISAPSIAVNTSSNQNGYYHVNNSFTIPTSYAIKPVLETDPLNGVNTWDLVLISRHILNLQPLVGPYKLIAADANKSGTVTTFDIVELRKLLLGTYTALPNNTSWRFVDKTQVFTNNENPFADVIKESIPFIVTFLGDYLHFDFIGIKIGDLDNSAISHSLLATDDRNAPFTAFNITRNDGKNWLVNEGETVELTFSNPTALSGYQMTLETDGLQPTEVLPGTGMSNDNFSLFDHAVTTVFEQGNTPFSVRFSAEKSGDLRNMLSISGRITPALAFGENGEKMQVNLRFEGEKSSIAPNPWSDRARISFHTSEATTATLKVFDVAGKLMYTTSSTIGKGEQAFELNASQIPAIGTLFYQINTAVGESFFGKMIKQ